MTDRVDHQLDFGIAEDCVEAWRGLEVWVASVQGGDHGGIVVEIHLPRAPSASSTPIMLCTCGWAAPDRGEGQAHAIAPLTL